MMKAHCSIVFLMFLMSTTCTDQGPLITDFYIFENTTNDTLRAVFFSSSPILQNKVDTIIVNPNDDLTLHSFDNDGADFGELDTYPNRGSYDSVSINIIDQGVQNSFIFYDDSCASFNNPLCEENYEFSEKGFKDGDVHEIYRFKYKP